MRRVILIIDTSRSYCSACNRNADPNESAHVMARMEGEGCGATFTHVGSHYSGDSIERAVKAMRPDLSWIDFYAEVAR